MTELEAIRDLVEHVDCFSTNGCALCAIRALLPALEAAYADLQNRRERNFDSAIGLRTAVNELRGLMSCGHPKACWQATKPDSVDAVVGYRCLACEDKRLAVAAALREAAQLMYDRSGSYDRNAILALIPTTDSQAIDAHDVALRKQEHNRIRDRIIADQAVRAQLSGD